MNWQAFSQVMWGISDLCFSAYDRLQGAERSEPTCRSATQSQGSNFQSQMIAFGRAAGLGMPKFSKRSASFSVRAHGVPYLVILTPGPDVVITSAFSHVTFPAGVPAELVSLIPRLNRSIESGCYYDDVEHDDGVSFYITKMVQPHEYTQDSLEAIVLELATRISTLDRVLKQYGYE